MRTVLEFPVPVLSREDRWLDTRTSVRAFELVSQVITAMFPLDLHASATWNARMMVPPASASTSSTSSTSTSMTQTPSDPPATVPPAPPAQAVRPARGEILVGLGLSFGSSIWRGDPLGYGGLTLGLRLFRFFTFYVGGSLGYGRVDQRLLTRIDVGGEFGWVINNRFRPRAFVGFVHQHEESLASVAQEPWGAILGIGTGIRHRAGVRFGVGLDFVVYNKGISQLAIGPDLAATYLSWAAGPDWTFTAGIAFTGHFRMF